MKTFRKKLKNNEFESPEYVGELSQFTAQLKTLQKLETQLGSWLKLTKELKSLAYEIGETLDTTDLIDLSSTLDEDESSESALSAIKTKIALLQEISAQDSLCKKQNLEYVKLNRRMEQLQKYKEKEPESATNACESLQQRTRESRERCERNYAEVLSCMKFVNSLTTEVASSDGVSDSILIEPAQSNSLAGLIKHELSAFRVSQINYLMNCQKLMAGKSEYNLINYNSYKNSFMESVREAFHEERVQVLREVESIKKRIKEVRKGSDTTEEVQSAQEEDVLRDGPGISFPLQVERAFGMDVSPNYDSLPALSWDEVDTMQASMKSKGL